MGQRMTERRLRDTGDRLRRLRAELAVVDEQVAHLAADADDKGLRAMVSETAGATSEYRDARLHVDAMMRHRQSIVEAIAELETRQDLLLDRMNRSRTM